MSTRHAIPARGVLPVWYDKTSTNFERDGRGMHSLIPWVRSPAWYEAGFVHLRGTIIAVGVVFDIFFWSIDFLLTCLIILSKKVVNKNEFCVWRVLRINYLHVIRSQWRCWLFTQSLIKKSLTSLFLYGASFDEVLKLMWNFKASCIGRLSSHIMWGAMHV